MFVVGNRWVTGETVLLMVTKPVKTGSDLSTRRIGGKVSKCLSITAILKVGELRLLFLLAQARGSVTSMGKQNDGDLGVGAVAMAR